MAESPSQAPTPTTPTASDTDPTQYWCHHCEKRVSIETLANLPDVICHECKNGFVESIPVTLTPPFSPPSLTPDHVDDPSFGSQFLQVLRLIAQAARDEDAPQQLTQDPQYGHDFLRIELDGWENDAREDENDENEENRNVDEEGDENENENENEDDEENEGGEDRSDNENEENIENEDEEDLRRRWRDVLPLRIRDFATRSRSGRNRILDWAEILNNSIEFRLEASESDRYIGNPADYMDAAGYEALLQNLAESDGGRRGAPRAAKSAVLELPTVEILSEQETIVCAICKDTVNVGETATKLPCGHVYHGDCIVPWLDSRNTCPVCRFELPTDDPEYEEERKKRVSAGASVGGASGSAGGNLSLG